MGKTTLMRIISTPHKQLKFLWECTSKHTRTANEMHETLYFTLRRHVSHQWKKSPKITTQSPCMLRIETPTLNPMYYIPQSSSPKLGSWRWWPESSAPKSPAARGRRRSGSGEWRSLGVCNLLGKWSIMNKKKRERERGLLESEGEEGNELKGVGFGL